VEDGFTGLDWRHGNRAAAPCPTSPEKAPGRYDEVFSRIFLPMDTAHAGGAYLRWFLVTGVIGGGHTTVARLLQTLAPVRASSKDRPVAQSSKMDMTIFIDDRGSDGLAREGLWQHGNGGEHLLGF
jgi:hypothetical protein